MQRYVMPIILDYVHKYVENFKPEHAEVSLFRGEVSLNNLQLKTDVLQKELSLPFTLVSGRINELFIHVSWASLATEPIVVRIDTIECTLSQRRPTEEKPTQSNDEPVVVGTPPSYMQGLIRRIVNSISLQVDHLILKYVDDDIVLSLNVNNLAVHSMDGKWMEAVLADNIPEMRRQISIDDLTLCLDKTDADGKIRVYQEPLLCKCKLLVRILTLMVSPVTREALCHRIQLNSPNFAFGMTNEQLVLLLRLFKNLNNPEFSPTNRPTASSGTQAESLNKNPVSPNDSWTTWAWSWLPNWTEDPNEVLSDASSAAVLPKSIRFLARLDNISMKFKMMKTNIYNKKRPHELFELKAKYTAVRGLIRVPTLYQINLGVQLLQLWTKETCCSPNAKRTVNTQDMLVFNQYKNDNISDIDLPEFEWPKEDLDNNVEKPGKTVVQEGVGMDVDPVCTEPMSEEAVEASFWKKLSPHIIIKFNHERSPPSYKPISMDMSNFEYSDWVEHCTLNIKLKNTDLVITTGHIHRINMLREILDGFEAPPELIRKTLTLEECEALSENIPQKRLNFECDGLRIRIAPCDHSATDTDRVKVFLNLESPLVTVTVTAPLYDHRVCSAASQMPKDEGPLWHAARTHLSAKFESMQLSISSADKVVSRPIVRLDMSMFIHYLLHQKYFVQRNSVIYSYAFKVKDLNICGSAPRILAALDTALSSYREEINFRIKDTTLCDDAFTDQELAAIDVNIEDITLRGSKTVNVIKSSGSIRTIKATVLQAIQESEPTHAWLFSGPEMTTNKLFLEFLSQYTLEPSNVSLDCLKIRFETMALSFDPLFYQCITYRPTVVTAPKENPLRLVTAEPSTSRKNTPPSSSGRGGSRADSSAELVHSTKLLSISSDTASEVKECTAAGTSKHAKTERSKELLWSGERSLEIYHRLRRTIIDIRTGIAMVYVPTTSPAAVGCINVQQAMENHSFINKYMLGLSVAGCSIESNADLHHLFSKMSIDGPNLFNVNDICKEDVFPWKIQIKETQLYTLDAKTEIPRSGKEKSLEGLRSCLTTKFKVEQKRVFYLNETTVTVPIIVKRLQPKSGTTGRKSKKKREETQSTSAEALKYLSSGVNFKPTTLKDFVRGPQKLRHPDQQTQQNVPEEPVGNTDAGPITSLCVGLHVVTTPISFTIEDYQVQTVMTVLHCLDHYVTALSDNPAGSMPNIKMCRHPKVSEELRERKKHVEDLVSIYEAPKEPSKIKTSLWFQWAADKIDMSFMTQNGRLFLELEDILSSVDLQSTYKQQKIKVHTANLRYQKRRHISDQLDEWITDPLFSKVIHPLETRRGLKTPHFLHITITQATTESLPPNWKSDFLSTSSKSNIDFVWEILINLASFSMVFRPEVVEHIWTFGRQVTSTSAWLNRDHNERITIPTERPLLFFNCAGLRVLTTIANDGSKSSNDSADETDDERPTLHDDTVIFDIGKIELQPNPNNPICRQPLATEVGRAASRGGMEGRQYELVIEDVCINTGMFTELVDKEATLAEAAQRLGGENPAAMWTQQRPGGPKLTPIVDSLKIGCIIAPAMTDSAGIMIYSKALELNFMSDLTIEISATQLDFLCSLVNAMNIRNSTMPEFGCAPAQCKTYMQLPAFKITKVRTSTASSRRLVKRTSTSTDSGVNSESGPASDASHAPHELGRGQSLQHNKIEFMEFFLTMGNVEFSFYILEGFPEFLANFPTPLFSPKTKRKCVENESDEATEEPRRCDHSNDSKRALSVSGSESADNMRILEAVVATLNLGSKPSPALRRPGAHPIMYFFFQQPNMYFIRQPQQTKLQFSLFNMQVGLGARGVDALWHDVILETANGTPDPVTDIPPALFTLKSVITNQTSGIDFHTASINGKVYMEVERPVSIHLTVRNLEQMKVIYKLMEKIFVKSIEERKEPVPKDILFYRIKQAMENSLICNVSVSMSQFSVTGEIGAVSFDYLMYQVATSTRPERLVVRSLVKGIMITMGQPDQPRHTLLHPLLVGFEIDCDWKKAAQSSAEEMLDNVFNIKMLLDVDNIVLDMRPEDVINIMELLKKIVPEEENVVIPVKRMISISPVCREHSYYNNDFRSGVFKVLFDSSFPAAYQLHVHGDYMTWTYPNLRAIRKLTLNPLPKEEKYTKCVLEYYCIVLETWEPHTYFTLTDSGPNELYLNESAPDAIFAFTWRFRLYPEEKEKRAKFIFQDKQFLPRINPLTNKVFRDDRLTASGEVIAHQLSRLIILDSVSCPCATPVTRICARIASVTVHLHNSVKELPKCKYPVEGYYLSPALKKNHRLLTLVASNQYFRHQETKDNGTCTTFESFYKCNMMDSSTGSFEELIRESHVQTAIVRSRPNDHVPIRIKCRMSPVHIKMDVPRLRTLECLTYDWLEEYAQYMKKKEPVEPAEEDDMPNPEDAEATVEEIANLLTGRVSFWIRNTTAITVRMGQKGTTEIVSLTPEMSIAYRWHSPLDDKKLHFALGSQSTDVKWSSGLEMIDGESRLLLGDEKPLGGVVYIYTRVETINSAKWLTISGWLTIANLMEFPVYYKIRAIESEKKNSRNIFTGKVQPETTTQSVICGEQCELTLKIKMARTEEASLWTGDIPLKPSPKEAPWLVKVPLIGKTPYISLWCRVVRSETDGRMLASLWPMYIMRSNLPLDITTSLETENDKLVVVKNTIGRGNRTQLLLPGTTTSKHLLNFCYSDMDTPMTKDIIQLHYGVSRTPVFKKYKPIKDIANSITEIQKWLKNINQMSKDWPFSTVTKHITNVWKPSILQPRTNCNIKYLPVDVCGGTSLEVVLGPAFLFCNAFPATISLYSYDAHPICRALPEFVIAPDSKILDKEFYLSIKINGEPCVSDPLKVIRQPIGLYQKLPECCFAVGHPIKTYLTSDYVYPLLTVYYDVVEGIELLGVSSSYAIVNHLGIPFEAATVILPKALDAPTNISTNKYSTVPAHKSDCWVGTAFGFFWIIGSWVNISIFDLKKYLFVTFNNEDTEPLPIKLDGNLVRRAISVTGPDGNSMPIIVTQHEVENRTYITLAHDPSPQYYIHNLTNYTISIAEPATDEDGETTIIPDCDGAVWCYKIEPNSYIYYTSPSHSMGFPQINKQSIKETKNKSLIIGIVPVEKCKTAAATDPVDKTKWSQKFNVSTARHWLKFEGKTLINVVISEYPHSTLIKLENIKPIDLSPECLRNFISGEDFHLNLMDLDQRLLKDNICLRKPNEWFDGKFSGFVFEMGASPEAIPLIIAHLNDVAVSVQNANNKDNIIEIMAKNIQVDNPHFDYGEYDFGVVATTSNSNRVEEIVKEEELCNIFLEKSYIMDRGESNPVQVKIQIDQWNINNNQYRELTEINIQVSPISLYIEDSYLKAVVELYRLAIETGSIKEDNIIENVSLALRKPLRLRRLEIEPMDVSLTLHTAVRLYIALDESPITLSEFYLYNIMTSPERLTQAFTLHYLSNALVGAGWVVGGLELLGAPGSIAYRVGNATGGIKGVATATAAAFIKSISAWAASLARNLDLLAGDDEHSQRAAAIRRRPPDRFFTGLLQGFSNFGINILGAVGGIAHHPLVGVAVGVNGSAMGLRRGLVGAVTKPLSAAADLVAIAGNSLLRQAGWDPTPERRVIVKADTLSYWSRNSVRWSLRLPNTTVLDGYEVLLNDVPVHLLVTYKALVVGQPETENIVEVIDFSKCVLEKRDGSEIIITIKTDRPPRERREDDEYQMSDETLARLARYTGTVDPDSPGMHQESRRIIIEASPTLQYSLLTIITALIHQNDNCHFNLL